MNAALFLILLLWQVGSNAPPIAPLTSSLQYSRYQRFISLPNGPGQSCAILDPRIFPHAANSLKDLRLYQDGHELPYAITLSEPEQLDSDTVPIRNLGLRGHNIVFDLAMPSRPYTDVTLGLAGHDFIATATVSGTRDPNYQNQTGLGEFTLFDLTSQHLSRSTTIHLQETTLPYLHIELAVTPTAGSNLSVFPVQTLMKMVTGVTVPPSREAQSIYTTATEATALQQRGRQTVAILPLPERIPIERLSFGLSPAYKANFSRDVHITDYPDDDSSSHPSSVSESLNGTIFRVRLTQSGREIEQQQLSIPATLGSNMQDPATVEVAIDNGDDPPLPITAIRLETRQRKLCFDAPAAKPAILFYGDPALTAPQYDYARLFSTTAQAHDAPLGPEQLNPTFHSRPDTRPLMERRPHLLWIALLAVICILAVVAIRSSKTINR